MNLPEFERSKTARTFPVACNGVCCSTERRNWDVKCRSLSSVDKAGRILGYKSQMNFECGFKKVHMLFAYNWENIQRTTEF